MVWRITEAPRRMSRGICVVCFVLVIFIRSVLLGEGGSAGGFKEKEGSHEK